MTEFAFQPGDTVRVKSARRRYRSFRVVEITASHVHAINAYGGEAVYECSRFELVERSGTATNGSPKPAPAPAAQPEPERPPPVSRMTLNDRAAVRVDPGEPIDFALKRFKKVVDRAFIFADLKRHSRFVPKSQRRLEKSNRARGRRAKL